MDKRAEQLVAENKIYSPCHVMEAAVRRWITVLYAATNNNDWKTAECFLHPEIRPALRTPNLAASLGRSLRSQEFLVRRTGGSSQEDVEDHEDGRRPMPVLAAGASSAVSARALSLSPSAAAPRCLGVR